MTKQSSLKIFVLLYFPVNSVSGLLRFARNDGGYLNRYKMSINKMSIITVNNNLKIKCQ